MSARSAAATERATVISALVERLGGTLCGARACDVCVLCSEAVVGDAKRSKGKGAGSKGDAAAKPRVKAGATVVRDMWVVDAVQSASRPELEDYAA